MPSATKKSQSDDKIATRMQLNGAEDERHVKSWFSGFTQNVASQDSSSVEDDVEDDIGENNEISGLGYVNPTDQLPEARQSRITDERLRMQLLGSSSRNGMVRGRGPTKPAGLQASKPKPHSKKASAAKSDDEDEARTSSITHKAAKTTTNQPSLGTEATPVPIPDGSSRKRGPAKPASYLDEILAERASKQKKRKKG